MSFVVPITYNSEEQPAGAHKIRAKHGQRHKGKSESEGARLELMRGKEGKTDEMTKR